MKTKSIRGFRDILPPETNLWQLIESKAKVVFEKYGFSEIRVPLLEHTELFTTGLGNTTDIVEKEMYTFLDKDNSSLTLRPEGTAGVVRSFIENSMHLKSQVSKLYYSGTMFRHERPQKGRYRGFNQIGAEMFGSDSPYSDCDIVTMLWKTMEELELTEHLKLEINSIGLPKEREKFKDAFIKFLTPSKDILCDDCKKKLEKNPLRIVDCKNENCQDITSNSPSILEYLSDESKNHFNKLTELLNSINIPFEINTKIVRGLDYYTNTVFELTTDKLGSQNAVAAGGRYNLLVEQLGGPNTPAIGFAIGIERLLLLYELSKNEIPSNSVDFFIACIGDTAHNESIKIAYLLRDKNYKVEIGYDRKSLKSQLKRANKLNAVYSIIIGDEEIKNNKLILRDMRKSSETEISITDINEIEI